MGLGYGAWAVENLGSTHHVSVVCGQNDQRRFFKANNILYYGASYMGKILQYKEEEFDSFKGLNV